MELGEFGVWTSYRHLGEENGAAAARLVEDLGLGTLWLGGSPRLSSVRPLLEASSRIVIATGIVNVWAYEPAQLAAEYAALEADFPGRLLLGIGVGHPEATSAYATPLAKMRSFLDGLDAAPVPVPPARRCLAALRAGMLALSAERSAGAHPYFVPVEHTRLARARLGPGPLLAPELACVLDADPERARATARSYAALYLGLRNYTANLRELGFGDADLEGGGSERLLRAVVPHGPAPEIAAAARVHLVAGAGHVCLQTVGVEGVPTEQWSALARALAG
jgi:probable F420-dependent oxidoreductase